jgi:hypothetical protein
MAAPTARSSVLELRQNSAGAFGFTIIDQAERRKAALAVKLSKIKYYLTDNICDFILS